MQISLKLIQSSPNPIRTKWDDDKLNELAQSLKEQGLIQPIKLRPLMTIKSCKYHGIDYMDEDHSSYDELAGVSCERCNEFRWELQDEDGEWIPQPVFEIVYGHRRVEAARRADFGAINANIEEMNDLEALIQSIIENLQREDMDAMDEGNAYQRLHNEPNNLTIDQIAEKIGKHKTWIARAIRTVEDPVSQIFVHHDAQSDVINRTDIIRQKLGDNVDLRKAVAQKSVDENLSREQLRRLADSIAAAPSEPARKRLLDWGYSELLHDPSNIKERAERLGAHDPMYVNLHPAPANQSWMDTPAVSSVISLMKGWMASLTDFRKADEIGKMSPEAKDFISRRAREFANALIEWADKLEQDHD